MIVTGCAHTSSELIDELDEVERLVLTEPDSAYVQLKNISRRDLHGRKHVSKYLLLSTVTDELTGVAHESMDDILAARRFYTHSQAGDSLLAVVHFYTGRVFADMGQTENALESLLRAKSHLDNTDDNHYWKGRVCYYIARLHYAEVDSRQYQQYAEQAVLSFTECRDTVNIVHSYNLIARNYQLSGDNEQALATMEKVNQFYMAINDVQGLMSSAQAIAGILLEMQGGPRKADSLMNRIYGDYNNGVVPLSHFPQFSRIKAAQGNYGEAETLLEEYMERTELTLPMRVSLTFLLSEYHGKQQQYRQAYEYLQTNGVLMDSLYRSELSNTLQEVEAKYEKQTLENEYKTYRSRNSYRIVLGAILAISAVFIIRIERKRKILALQANMASLREQLRELDTLKENLIRVFNEKVEKETRLVDILSSKLNYIQQIADYLFLYENNPGEFKKRIHNTIIKAERDDYFGDLHEVVNEKYAGIVDYLTQRFPALSSNEINLCCLICLGFNNNQIGILFGHTNAGSIFTVRHKLRKKLALWPHYDSLEVYLLQTVEELRTGAVHVQSDK